MKEIIEVGKLLFAAIGGWLGWFLGGWDGPIYALVAFITIDYITGLMCAISDKDLSSEIGFKGIAKKVFILMLVGIGAILDREVIRTGEVVRTAVIFYYLSNEGISILENASRLNLPVPERLSEVLKQLKNENGRKED